MPIPPLDSHSEAAPSHESSELSQGKTLHQLALKAQTEGQNEQACVIWRGILARQPQDLIAAHNLGIALRKLGRLAESEAVLRQALKFHGDNWTIWYALGTTLSAWENSEEALHAYVNALEHAPEEASIHYAIGSLLLLDDEPIDAVFHFREAIRNAPRHAPAHVGAGSALIMMDELQEAELLLTRATELDPFDAQAHFTLANLWLGEQNAKRGWQAYEWRFQSSIQLKAPNLQVWQGEPLRSKTLLIIAEQGDAATFFFLRFLRFLPKEQIILKCKENLIPLVRSSGFVQHFWPVESATPPSPAPTPDCWCSLGSLPLLVENYQNPAVFQTPYLRPDPSMTPIWQKQFGKRPTIALAWKSSGPLGSDIDRGFPLETYAPLCNLENIDFVALHPDLNQQEKQWLSAHHVHYLEQGFDEQGGFVEAAALIEALSLVITPGGVFAHIAGALAKPAFVITRYLSEWMWKHEHGDSFWYPSLQVFPYTYAQTPHDAIVRIAKHLQELQRGNP